MPVTACEKERVGHTAANLCACFISLNELHSSGFTVHYNLITLSGTVKDIPALQSFLCSAGAFEDCRLNVGCGSFKYLGLAWEIFEL